MYSPDVNWLSCNELEIFSLFCLYATILSCRERQLLMMTVMMCAAYLFAWTPYAIVSLKATFGDPTQVTYLEAAIPSVIAKTATVYNPLIYVSMNEKFRRCLLKVSLLVFVLPLDCHWSLIFLSCMYICMYVRLCVDVCMSSFWNEL